MDFWKNLIFCHVFSPEYISRLPDKQIKFWINKYVPHHEIFYGRLNMNIFSVICKRILVKEIF